MEKINNNEVPLEKDEEPSISAMTLHNLKNQLEIYKMEMNYLQNRIQGIERAIKNLKND
jgi:cell division protein FtsB